MSKFNERVAQETEDWERLLRLQRTEKRKKRIAKAKEDKHRNFIIGEIVSNNFQEVLRFKPGTIVLDVPCSGLGVLAARPDVRRHRKAVQLQELMRVQAAMLDAAYAELAIGGRIAYITCTQNPDENEDQICAFLGRHSGVALEAEWNSPAEDRLLEGMYAALLVKR